MQGSPCRSGAWEGSGCDPPALLDGAGTSRVLPSARVGGPAQQQTWVWGRLRGALGHSGEAVSAGTGEQRGNLSPEHPSTPSSPGHLWPWTFRGEFG